MTGPEVEEPADLSEDLVAVCLDANAMSKGRLNLDALADLLEVIDSQELDVQVWVPEPVLWEWAEHLASDLSRARENYREVRAQAVAAGAEELVGPAWTAEVDVGKVVLELAGALEKMDGTSVLCLSDHPNAAADGLRDQVLLLGAGRRKGNVKAGAADGASFRLAEAELNRFGGSLLVVSGDQDARRFFEGKPGIVVVNSLSRAKAAIVRMRTGSEIAVERVRAAVATRLIGLSRIELGNPEIEGVAVLKEDSRLRGRIVESDVALLSVDRVVGIDDVEVSRSDGYGTALVDALVSVERELHVLSDVNAVVEMDVETFDELRATLEVSAESDDGVDWDIVVDKVHLA